MSSSESLYPSKQVTVTILKKNPKNLLDECERHLIGMVLVMTEGNRTRAARILGLSLRGLRIKINKYDISHPVKSIPESMTLTLTKSGESRRAMQKFLSRDKKASRRGEQFEYITKAEVETRRIDKSSSLLLNNIKKLDLELTDDEKVLSIMETLDEASEMINQYLTNKKKETKRK